MALTELGLIINPIAGMGGKVALKGTDGAEVLAAARARGAVPESPLKARRALEKLLPLTDDVLFLTAAGSMGEDLCREMGYNYRVVYTPKEPTDADDTLSAAEAIAACKPTLLLFAGGDGTARNICARLGESQPVLGIPAGVKIQSAVFALDPEAAGQITARLVQGEDISLMSREVVDLDEDEYRTGHVSAKLYGSMKVPFQPKGLQSMKQSGFSSEGDQLNGIANFLEEKLEPDTYYAIGSGSNAKCLSKLLGLKYELLGVDILYNGKILALDVTEEELWQYTQKGPMKILVSPIGGQGFIFGRGNHQFSARVLKAVGKNNIQVLAPQSKLVSIQDFTLHADCGDPEVNAMLRGYYRILCGWAQYHVMKCV